MDRAADRGGMAERPNALVLKTRGAKTPEGSNPSAPALKPDRRSALFLLKIIKILETFAFWFCTLWVTSRLEKEVQAA
jgi:hypothetical protein